VQNIAMKNLRLIAWFIVSAMTTNLYGQTGASHAEKSAAHTSEGDPAIAAGAVNGFGLKLFEELSSHAQQKNLFISPLSIYFALAMTESGAGGSTRTVMRDTLAVRAEVSEDALHHSSAALLKSLQSQKGVQLAIANALWSDARLPLAPAFVKRCHDQYQADATSLDFASPTAAGTINAWVKKKTEGKIPEIVTPADLRATEAMLTNAVYFKGGWQYKFDKSETKEGDFHLAGEGPEGKSKKVQFMHNATIPHAYQSGAGFEAAVLPYKSSSIQLYAILPAPGKTPEEALSEAAKQAFSGGSSDLDLKLPRFTLNFDAKLKAALERLGMAPAFQRNADFKPMGSARFYIGDVLHKTRLEVDEEGTVAAATTAVEMRAAMAMRRPEKKILVFDRPFALLLRDGATNTILFAGVVYDPH
jgi:serpin B